LSDGSTPAPPEPPGGKKAGKGWVLPVAVVVALLVGVAIGYAAGNQAGSEETAEPAATVTVVAPISTSPTSPPPSPGASVTSTPSDASVIRVASKPQTIDNVTMTVTSVDVSRGTVVSVNIDNKNDHSVACNYIASMVVDGSQVDNGDPAMSDVAAGASLDSWYRWRKSIDASFKELRLQAKCWDEKWGGGGIGKGLYFDVAATPS
jgi:hypothetical protein